MVINTKRKRRGVTLLEAMLSGILTIFLVYQADLALERRNEDIRNVSASTHLKVLMQASNRFMRDYAACIGSTASTNNCNISMTSLPYVLSPNNGDNISKLFTSGYLPPNFGYNSYNQNWRLVIYQTTTSTGTLGPIAGIILTGNDTQHGNGLSGINMQVNDASQIAAMANSSPYGMSGYQATSNVIQGAFNGWSLQNSNNYEKQLDGMTINNAMNAMTQNSNTGITLAAYITPDTTNGYGDWLSRVVVPGHPEYNQMETAIDMNDNDLNNVGSVNFTNGTSGGNGALTTIASMAANGSDLIMTAPTSGTLWARTDTLQIGKNTTGKNATIQVNDTTNTMHIQTQKEAAISLEGTDVYAGAPTKGSTGVYNLGSGVFRANSLEVPSLNSIIVSTTDQSGNNVRVSLDDMMSRYRGEENWLALSGQYITKPSCYGNATPQIITTLHGFEGGITQDSYNGALTPQRTVPMRVRAVNQSDQWQVVVEYLNPYTECGGGPDTWSTSIIQPQPNGACAAVNSTSGTAGTYSNDYVIAQTYCYYPKTEAIVSTPSDNP